MTENFTITETELEAIRSVSAYIGTIAHVDAFRPSNAVQDDRNEVHRMLSRLAPAPPIEEVASRPNGEPDDGADDPTAGSPIGIVRDHPSHDEDTPTEHLIIWALLPLAKLPGTVANLVKDAVHGNRDEQRRAALAAVDAIARLRREPDAEIPF